MLTQTKEKVLPDRAVYMDVVNGGHLMPKRKKYTMRDFKALVEEGYSQIDARWILICSNIWYYHNTGCGHTLSKHIDTAKFCRQCQLGIALL